ncbi:MAG: hypothetical protein EZS28_005221 [Streblomastix strix]|uniref:Uncharacterized protein n=1 Tax=Streblomastix strix TaxID=222440 RepID=A0A5J4WW56_9EUKA|nr:MAG: hypothetical protein EZS28_005221 [Streblomastix strix]
MRYYRIELEQFANNQEDGGNWSCSVDLKSMIIHVALFQELQIQLAFFHWRIHYTQNRNAIETERTIGIRNGADNTRVYGLWMYYKLGDVVTKTRAEIYVPWLAVQYADFGYIINEGEKMGADEICILTNQDDTKTKERSSKKRSKFD